MAMPITIVGSNFQHAWEDREKDRIVLRIQKSMLDQSMRVEDIVGVFTKLDTSGDGEVGLIEFKSMLHSIDINLSAQEARRIFALFDEDGSGSLTYIEFVKIVFPTYDIEGMSSVDVTRSAKGKNKAAAKMSSQLGSGSADTTLVLEELRKLTEAMNAQQSALQGFESRVSALEGAPAAAWRFGA